MSAKVERAGLSDEGLNALIGRIDRIQVPDKSQSQQEKFSSQHPTSQNTTLVLRVFRVLQISMRKKPLDISLVLAVPITRFMRNGLGHTARSMEGPF
jgi:hypothetical protein